MHLLLLLIASPNPGKGCHVETTSVLPYSLVLAQSSILNMNPPPEF